MPVEIVPCAVVAHRRAWVRMAGGDLHVAQVDTGIEHGGDEGVAQHVRMHPRRRHPSSLRQGTQAPLRGVAIHPGASAAARDRPAAAAVDCAFDGSLDRWWEWGLDDLAALATDLQHAVAVFLAEVFDVRPTRLEDPQTEKAEHGDQGEVIDVRRGLPGSEHGLELQV